MMVQNFALDVCLHSETYDHQSQESSEAGVHLHIEYDEDLSHWQEAMEVLLELMLLQLVV